MEEAGGSSVMYHCYCDMVVSRRWGLLQCAGLALITLVQAVYPYWERAHYGVRKDIQRKIELARVNAIARTVRVSPLEIVWGLEEAG